MLNVTKKFLTGALVASLSTAMLFAGFAQNGNVQASSKPPIIVGSKSFTENILIGDMMYDLLKANLPGAQIINKQDLGGTMVPWNALLSGQIDMYTEYTGTGLIDILKHPVIHNAQAVYNYVAKEYPAKFKVYWLKPIGFNDTYAIAMPKALAIKDHVTTISDLSKVANQLVFGAEPEFFSRPDGYPGLVNDYGLHFKSTSQINVGLKYEAIAKNDLQVIDVFSTDGDLVKYHMVVLKDNKNFYPPYFAAPIVRQDIIKAYPKIPSILNKLANKISNEEMQKLNFAVDVQHKSASAVAQNFLVSIKLLKK
jgi:osmoprotectant transport system substrate-binding protein